MRTQSLSILFLIFSFAMGCGISSQFPNGKKSGDSDKKPNGTGPKVELKGADSSGGGQGIACYDGSQITSLELVDFYEGRTLRQTEPELGAATLTVNEKLMIALKRIKKFDPYKYNIYQQQVTKFFDNAMMLENIQLTLTEDSELQSLPTHCKVVQLAVQRQPKFPEDKRFIVSKDLWDVLDNDNKAGLILHEIIYWEARVRHQENSVNSRYFNSNVTSAKLDSYTQDAYEKLVDLAELNSFSFGHQHLLKEKHSFDSAKRACEAKGWFVDVSWSELPLKTEENLYTGLYQFIWDDDHSFWLAADDLTDERKTRVSVINAVPPDPKKSVTKYVPETELHYIICMDYYMP